MNESTYARALDTLVGAFATGHKLLLCGNGGSAADCAHILGELVKSFVKPRPPRADLVDAIGEPWAAHLQRGLPAIDLTCNNALIAAVINDIDGHSVYAQQVMAYGKPGDVILGISTSGNAENVRRALKTARAMGLKTIGLTGETGGKIRELCDILLNVDATETAQVQQLHLELYHKLCRDIEDALF
ncbi:MAG: SIS domain-containing protein [Clostridiales bacterium]|nr:SIS domain-containing protein [Clostridiales bacterium]